MIALMMDHIDREGNSPCHGNPEAALASRAFRKTLTACTSVNRLFSQEALRLLWHSLDDLNPLLDLLPSDAIKVYPDDEKHVARQLTPDDWKRVDNYVSLVRSVTIRNEDGEMVQLFQESFHHQILFPQLASLDFRWVDPSHLSSLLAPTLQHIRVCLEWSMPSSYKKPILESLGDLPNLRVLEVDGGFEEICSSVAPELDCLFHEMSKLTELDLAEITLSVSQLRLLQHLPDLQLLAFATENIMPRGADKMDITPHICRFTNLQKLILYGRVQQVAYVISDLGVQPKKEIRIGTTYLETCTSSFSDLFYAIGTLPESLEVLIVEAEPYGYNTDLTEIDGLEKDQQVIPASSLIPLLKFRKLRRMKLEVDHLIDLYDDDVANIANAFPDIEHLVLSNDQARLLKGTHTRITPSSLIHFAKDTPKLKSLSLYITSHWVPYPTFHPSFRSSSSLEWFDVGLSRIMDDDLNYNENDVCFVLAELFPNLQYINWSLPFGMADEEDVTTDLATYREIRRRKLVGQTWDKIESMLPKFQLFRNRAQESEPSSIST
ncbi:hypothetical protein FRC02_000656 [Tulasnella sp. 418]|nr:hypothetical protein FRC02_000656 [Tulasnella sp. 418]